MKMLCTTKRVEVEVVTLFMLDEQGRQSFIAIAPETDTYEIGKWYEITAQAIEPPY